MSEETPITRPPPRIDIDMRLEDGVCVAQRVVDPSTVPTLVAPGSSILRRWNDMTLEQKEDFVFAMTGSRPPRETKTERGMVWKMDDGTELDLRHEHRGLAMFRALEVGALNVSIAQHLLDKFPHAVAVEACHERCNCLGSRGINHGDPRIRPRSLPGMTPPIGPKPICTHRRFGGS